MTVPHANPSGIPAPLFRDFDWVFSRDHSQAAQLMESQTVWGRTLCRIWLPGSDSVVQVRVESLAALDEAGGMSGDHLGFVAAAARVADALSQDILLAPIESAVIPLPHQIYALRRAVSDNRVRYLLADEVGLGKTIEAGLIMRELKLRGLVKRCLVVAPKGLALQWASEMKTHFGEEFKLLVPSDFEAFRRVAGDQNVWRMYDQVICPLDSVKPMDKRRGWTKEEIAEHNRERFEDLVSAGWDMVVVDEAHRLGGSTDQVARYRLGLALAEASPYLLLLSATPHQGKSDAFFRLVALLDGEEFPDIGSVTRDRVQPYVIRTEKRRAITAEGKPLFKPRKTQLEAVQWQARHSGQRTLYEAVTNYVREGYNQAIREKKSYVGFLMILMQRLITSSTRAIRTTLERRLDALETPDEQLTLFPGVGDEDWSDLDGQEQIDALLKTRLSALKNEKAEVKLLLEAARRIEASGPDAKAEALLDWIYKLQQEEGDAELKVLVFTEFVPTQDMLRAFLMERGFTVATLNGSMSMDERRRVQRAFAEDARVLISTDAGGEGLNLQFAHVVVNFDIPWNPMRLEQRIGRVDRIGQKHVVRAMNFVLADTVEYRVREVLEQKLAVILEEFGVDKTGDVLDSAQAAEIFDELFTESILDPNAIGERVASAIDKVQEEARANRQAVSILGGVESVDPTEAQRLAEHPILHWVEQMTVRYVRWAGGKVERRAFCWDLVWPDGQLERSVVFNSGDADRVRGANQLTLEDSRIRGLTQRLMPVVSAQPMPVLKVDGLPSTVAGTWSLWSISLRTSEWNQRRIIPLFLSDDGKVMPPTARFVWDQLLQTELSPVGQVVGDAAASAFEATRTAAEEHGAAIFEEISAKHQKRIDRERAKLDHAFTARRQMIDKLGLPAVRQHRWNLLNEEERLARQTLERASQSSPELQPLAVCRVEGIDDA